MLQLLLQFMFLGVVLATSTTATDNQCAQVLNSDALYSLQSLQLPTHYSYTLEESQGSFTYDLSDIGFTDLVKPFSPLTLSFNFCETVKFTTPSNTCETEANTTGKSFALISTQNPTDCTADMARLTTDSKYDNYSFKLIDEDAPEDGVIYTLNKTDSTNSFYSSITYIIYCDLDNSSNNFTIQGWRRKLNATSQQYFIQATSYYGCPSMMTSKIWEVLDDNKYPMALQIIQFGVALCFFGVRFINHTSMMIGNVTGFGVMLVIFQEFVVRYNSEDSVAKCCFYLCHAFAGMFGFIVSKNQKLATFLFAAWFGIVIGLLMNNAIFYKIQLTNATVILWVTVAVLGVTMGVLSCFFKKHCVMICSGIVGAYLVIRPFGWLFGSFPNELQLAEQVKYGILMKVPSIFYVYMALILVVGMIGVKFQWEMLLRRKQEEVEKDLEVVLIDPDFVELHKPLLEKEDADLTDKEKETKAKLIRIQQSLDKQHVKETQLKEKVQKLKKKKKLEKEGKESGEENDEDEDDQKEEGEEAGSEDEEEDSNDVKKGGKKDKEKNNQDISNKGFLASLFTRKTDKKQPEENIEKSNSKQLNKKNTKTKMTKDSHGKQKKHSDSEDSQKDEEEPTTITTKLSGLFAGIGKKREHQYEEKDNNSPQKPKDIELDDLSETHSTSNHSHNIQDEGEDDDRTQSNVRNKSKKHRKQADEGEEQDQEDQKKVKRVHKTKKEK